MDDEGFAHLPPLPKLMTLRLHGTKITDQALQKLPALPALVDINVRRTKVTAEAARQFSIAHPKVNVGIDSDPAHLDEWVSYRNGERRISK